MTPPKIIDVYGFFGTIAGYWGRNEYSYPPWHETALDNFTYDKIDKLFFTLYGDRPISRYVAEYLKMGGGELPGEYERIISDYVLDMFRDQWARLTVDFTSEYNPVQNYDMTETETNAQQASGTDTTTNSYANYKETQKFGHTVSSDTSSNIFGFNTSAASGVGDSTGANTTVFGASGDSGDTLEITGTKSSGVTYGSRNDGTRTLTRAGNIGVQTATDMLKSDVGFWTDNNFWYKIVADMASILTIPIYE